ncbi:MFS transporter [Rhizobium wuzhouense]|uniref:MFS transporter n=1 Tax=Rhizobium wuzhouense TaxID=1986026 RepID=A0ABX5NZA1_9HYPH|nr:MFS transporter [Rhizobium wuzhouense]PYB77011.1 MFS transporter [Rhizobium wuzhouense]
MTRHPVFVLALADIISLLGSRLSMIAIPWLVLTTTGDPMRTGIIGFAEMLPYILAKGLGGPLIDRVGARVVAMTADMGSTIVVTLVPLLHFSGALSFEILVPIVVVLGVLRGPADAAKQAMVPAVATLAGVKLERITGLMGIIDRLAGTAGAAAAGALVAVFGAAPAIILTAGAYCLAALIIAFGLRLHPVQRAEVAGDQRYRVQFNEGWRFFRRDPVLVSIVAMVAATNLIDQAYAAVLVPVWVKSVGNAALLGAVLAVFSGAAVIGSAFAAWLGPRLPRLLVYTVAFLVCGAPRFLLFAVDAPLPAIFFMLLVTGFASGFLNPIIAAVIFERIPAPFVGRVSSLVGALTWGLIPFGGLVGGGLITTIGLSAAFAICGAFYFVVTMLPLAVPAFRAMAAPSR